jgi:hypothetical protein
MRRILLAAALTSLVACGGGNTGSPPTQSGAAAANPPAAPDDFLASNQTFDVPEGPREAAAVLVAKARDPRTGAAGVREILTRAGVPIINRAGVRLNRPATPTKIGIHIYDFQVPMLAAAIQEGKAVRVARVAELAQVLVGVELPEAVLTEALAGWFQSAPDEPGNPEALDAAVISEIARIDASHTAPGEISLVSYLLLSSNLYGAKGVLQAGPPAALLRDLSVLPRAQAATPCPPEDYDPLDGAGVESGKKLVDWVLDLLKDRWAPTDPAGRAHRGGGQTSSAKLTPAGTRSTTARM